MAAETKARHISPAAPPIGSTCRHIVYSKACGKPAKSLVTPIPKFVGYGNARELVSQPEWIPVCGVHRNELMRDWQRRYDNDAEARRREERRRKVTISDNLAMLLTEALSQHFGVAVAVGRGRGGLRWDSSIELTITPETAQQLLDVLGSKVHSGRTTRND